MIEVAGAALCFMAISNGLGCATRVDWIAMRRRPIRIPALATLWLGLAFPACSPDEAVGPNPGDDDSVMPDDDSTNPWDDDDTLPPGSCAALEAEGWTIVDELGLAILDRGVPVSSTPVGGASTYAPPHPHMFAAPDEGVGVVLGWAASGGGVHLTVVDGHGEPTGDDFQVDGRGIHGLAVGDDGYAVLVYRPSDELALVEVSRSGTVQFDQTILSGDYWWQTTWWMGDGRLLWTGSEYVVYVHVSHGGHEGDTLCYLSGGGAPQSGGWTWGCSHSMDQRVTVHDGRTTAICLSDCYPGQGIFLNNSTTISLETGGNCAGNIDGSLGGLVTDSGGSWFNFGSSMDRNGEDIALVHIGQNGSVGPKQWLTDTPGQVEASAHLAPFEGGLLAAWQLGNQTLMVRLLATGEPDGDAVVIPTRVAAHDDFFVHTDGDVGWAYATQGSSTINVVRATGCD